MKVTPFIQTIHNDKYLEFILQKFEITKLKTIFIFLNEDDNKIEFNDNKFHYFIYNFTAIEPITYKLPLPIILDDFINDCHRCGITLHWSEKILKKFVIKDILDKNEVEKYYSDFLIKINKSHELLSINKQ